MATYHKNNVCNDGKVMRRFSIVINILIWFVIIAVPCAGQNNFPVLTGPYLGQPPPGDSAVIFAPGIVSTGLFTRDIAITPDGKEIYFGAVVGQYIYSTIMVTKLVNGRWTEPEVASFAAIPSYKTVEPCISPDGKKFFFSSNRPAPGKEMTESDYDIWVMERTADGWGDPKNLGAPVNTPEGEYFPSVTDDGTLYFTKTVGRTANDIYRSRLRDGRYQAPEKLPPEVNCGQAQFNAFIAPDESYIIVPVIGRKDSKGRTDYYIAFRNSDDTWSEPVNMGDAVNTKTDNEYSPYVSRDGKYFFFMSPRLNLAGQNPVGKLTRKNMFEMHNQPGNGNPAIYWIDAALINRLKSPQ
ncbi:MAG: hypothetical protein NTV54_10050 [Ignavibacteriales bacterium]|nr:hypothetical protein [Ignavibacteriales bacterium]